MKKFCTLLMAIVAFGVLPSVSQAFCTASGEIVRIFVTPEGGTSMIGVRTSTSGSTTFRFTTTDQKVINAALAAQSSHMRVTINGGIEASVCGMVVGSVSAGGTVASIVTAP